MKKKILKLEILIVSLILILGSLSNVGYANNPINNSNTRISENLEILFLSAIKEIPPSEEWNSTWGIPSSYSSSNGIAIDTENNIYTVGQEGNLLLPSNITLYKTNSSGVHLWNRTIEGEDFNRGFGVATNGSEYVYITGYVNLTGPENCDVVVAAYNKSGDLEWLETWGGPNMEVGQDIVVDSMGNIYVAGWTQSYGVDNWAILLLKYNSTGDFQWNQTWDTTGMDIGWRIDIDKSTGDIYLTGETWQVNNQNAVLLKYHGNKTKLWERIYDSGNNESGWGVKVDFNGDICITGNVFNSQTSEQDIFIAKYNKSGYQLWNSTLGIFDVNIRGMDVDKSNNIYLVGIRKTFFTGMAVWFGKFSTSGSQRWTKTWGSTGRDFGEGIAIDSLNYIYVTGALDADDLLGIGDQFILKLSNITVFINIDGSGPGPTESDDDDDSGSVKNNIWLWLLIFIGSVSAIAATSLYYYHYKNKKAKLTRKKGFQESDKISRSTQSSEEILKRLYDKSYLLPIFETKNIEKISEPMADIHLTVVSKEFLRKLDSINVSIEEKIEFLKEMMLFSPVERNEILDNIIKRLNSYSEVK